MQRYVNKCLEHRLDALYYKLKQATTEMKNEVLQYELFESFPIYRDVVNPTSALLEVLQTWHWQVHSEKGFCLPSWIYVLESYKDSTGKCWEGLLLAIMNIHLGSLIKMALASAEKGCC